jgi:tRNA nucleotidyltransferase/poly(A) polymerase
LEKVIYTGVMLDDASKEVLKRKFSDKIPKDWKWISHHMTIKFGELDENLKSELLGKQARLKIVSFGVDENAAAVEVSGFYSENKIPHVTLAINENNGAKPVMSNKIPKENWVDVYEDIIITGIAEEYKTKKTNMDIFDILKKENLVAYVVGGSVRDSFIGKDSKDLDLIITGTPMDDLEIIFSKYGKVDKVGASFGVLKFTPPGGEEIDIAIPRTEKQQNKLSIVYKGEEITIQYNETDSSLQSSKNNKITKISGEDNSNYFINVLADSGFNVIDNVVYAPFEKIKSFLEGNLGVTKVKKLSGYQNFDVKSDHTLPIEKDLYRRDFTINSIARDVDGNLIDPFGGVEDLKNKIIRLTNPDAFSDDPLRMLRAVQFAARFNFTIEPETFRAIKENATKIKEITPKRILIEFDKIVSKGDPYVGAKLLINTGLYENMFDSPFSGNLSAFKKVKTNGEFIFWLLNSITDNPSIFYKNKLEGENLVEKEIQALSLLYNPKKPENKFEKRIVYNQIYRIYPKVLESYFTELILGEVLMDFNSDEYPKTTKELAVTGPDLIKIGLKGKELTAGLNYLLGAVYYDRVINEKESLLEYINNNMDSLKTVVSSLKEDVNAEKYKKAVFYDFDGTLMNSPMPDQGKVIYKEKTGLNYPHLGWWGRPESLDLNIFDIKPNPDVYRQFKLDSTDYNTYVVLLTNRIGKLSSEVKSVLEKNNIFFDFYSFKEDSRTKGDRVLDIVNNKLKDVARIEFYDDDDVQLMSVSDSLDNSQYSYDVYKVSNGKIIK